VLAVSKKLEMFGTFLCLPSKKVPLHPSSLLYLPSSLDFAFYPNWCLFVIQMKVLLSITKAMKSFGAFHDGKTTNQMCTLCISKTCAWFLMLNLTILVAGSQALQTHYLSICSLKSKIGCKILSAILAEKCLFLPSQSFSHALENLAICLSENLKVFRM